MHVCPFLAAKVSHKLNNVHNCTYKWEEMHGSVLELEVVRILIRHLKTRSNVYSHKSIVLLCDSMDELPRTSIAVIPS